MVENKQDKKVEVVQINDYKYKVRGSNRKRNPYTVIVRKDGSLWCDCISFKYNGAECKHIKTVVAFRGESKLTSYERAQKHCDFKPGGKVKVICKAFDNEKGWQNSWVEPEMDWAVGRTFVVQSVQWNGVFLNINYPNHERTLHLGFPYFVLKKVKQ